MSQICLKIVSRRANAFQGPVPSACDVAQGACPLRLYLYGKALENARRVALTLAVGRDAGVGPVTEGDATYACRLVRYLVGDLIRAVKETVSESPDEKAKKRILQVVAAAGSGGIPRNELTRKTQFIRKTFRDEYLDDLVESGELTVSTNAKGGVLYFIGS